MKTARRVRVTSMTYRRANALVIRSVRCKNSMKNIPSFSISTGTMKHERLTDELAADIIEKMQGYCEAYVKGYCSASVQRYEKTIWKAYTKACYRPVAEEVRVPSHPDHFGIIYQGWGGKDWNSLTQGFGPEALDWLRHLLDPEGPFRELLPYLYHTDPEEVLKDCGFVFHNLDGNPKVNAGLLWTFCQASRMFFEYPARMERFQYARGKLPMYPTMATFMTLVMQPCSCDLDQMWSYTVVAHGEALGAIGYQKAENFLNGKTFPVTVHNTWGSHNCFGSFDPPDWTSTQPRKKFDTWVALFEKERTKNVPAAAAA